MNDAPRPIVTRWSAENDDEIWLRLHSEGGSPINEFKITLNREDGELFSVYLSGGPGRADGTFETHGDREHGEIVALVAKAEGWDVAEDAHEPALPGLDG